MAKIIGRRIELLRLAPPVLEVLDSPMKGTFQIEKTPPFWFAFYSENKKQRLKKKLKSDVTGFSN